MSDLAEQLAEAPDVAPGLGDIATIHVASSAAVDQRLERIEAGLGTLARIFICGHLFLGVLLLVGMVLR